jgi:hypothetical protein
VRVANEIVSLVQDGNNGNEYSEIGDLVFSLDSRRSVYCAKKGGSFVAVIDGKEGQEYDRVDWAAISHDSRHVAYNARLFDKDTVVVDGVRGDVHGRLIDIGGGELKWDDSDRIVYLGQEGSQIFLVEESMLEADTAKV